MHYQVRQPETEEEFKLYYQLRWALLRAPWKQPQGSEVDDLEEQCFHLMAVNEENEIIGVARLQFNSASEAQVRYMAVCKTEERKGIGRKLIASMEDHAKNLGIKTIVLDAREQAVGFYKKLGYQQVKKSYLLFDEIQHYQMLKQL